MDEKLLIEAGALAGELIILANKTGDPRIKRLADKACDREHRRWQKWDKEQSEKRQKELKPTGWKIGRPYLKDRPRAGVWRHK